MKVNVDQNTGINKMKRLMKAIGAVVALYALSAFGFALFWVFGCKFGNVCMTGITPTIAIVAIVIGLAYPANFFYERVRYGKARRTDQS